MEISAEERKRREIRRSHYENKFKPQCNNQKFVYLLYDCCRNYPRLRKEIVQRRAAMQ